MYASLVGCCSKAVNQWPINQEVEGTNLLIQDSGGCSSGSAFDNRCSLRLTKFILLLIRANIFSIYIFGTIITVEISKVAYFWKFLFSLFLTTRLLIRALFTNTGLLFSPPRDLFFIAACQRAAFKKQTFLVDKKTVRRLLKIA